MYPTIQLFFSYHSCSACDTSSLFTLDPRQLGMVWMRPGSGLEWYGNGLGVVWEWSGSGLGMVWKWSGSGLGVVWEWSGSGLEVVWEWSGSGLGVVWDVV
jgi:hypothetical protein